MQECLYEIIKTIVTLYTCNGRLPLNQIEFTFNYRSSGPKEIGYVRNDKSKKCGIFVFETADELYRTVKENKYIGIHRGPCYYNKKDIVKERKNPFIINPQPLIFDIDASDYSEMRTCKCDRKQTCNGCWEQHMIPAIETVYAVCSQLGFERMLTVFSGRRGVHVYVTDPSVWYLTTDQRRMIIKRIQANGTLLDEDVTLKPWHLTKSLLYTHPSTGYLCVPITPNFRPETDTVHHTKATVEQIREWIQEINTKLIF